MHELPYYRTLSIGKVWGFADVAAGCAVLNPTWCRIFSCAPPPPAGNFLPFIFPMRSGFMWRSLPGSAWTEKEKMGDTGRNWMFL